MDPITPAVHGPCGAVAVLVGVVALLDQACREGLHATSSNRSYRVACLAADAQSLCYAAVDLLPGGLFPDMDRPPVTGTPLLGLIRQAGRLAATLPVEQAPPGTARLAARIAETVGDHS